MPDESRVAGLPLTGERTTPGVIVENYWFRRHEAAYLAASDWLGRAGRVLEAGLGEGYGAGLLTARGNTVVGVDYDTTATSHARRRYPAIGVVRGNVVALPFRPASFDAVVSMQVVEHLWDQPRYVAESARVLRPDGVLVLSTPNRLTFSPGYDPASGPPANPFHTREFSGPELADLLSPRFPDITRYGLHHGPRLCALDRQLQRGYGQDLVTAQLATPAANWPAGLLDTVASVTTDDFTLTTGDTDTALDLIYVSRKPSP
ncbi:MAG TPA: class I SAM-dependent methyltransferase [Micromonosporaceae bacterium]|nr:class I SAM-dependent methyltransferase [Micromonosporaceae bacterium]